MGTMENEMETITMGYIGYIGIIYHNHMPPQNLVRHGLAQAMMIHP